MQSRSAGFGGELAPILFYTLHPSAFLVGSVCGGIVFGLLVVLGWMGLGRIAPLVAQAVAFLFVIRVAMNSAYGENPLGGVLKATGSDWPMVLGALGRLILLNLVWAVPMVIMGSALSAAPSSLLAGGGVGGPTALLAMGMLLLPPLFLVSSVAADSIADLLDPDHWRAVFADRWHDVVTLFVAYVGGVAAAGGLSFTVGVSLGSGKPGPTVFFMAVAGSYTAGVFLLLLGRLVGGFLRTAGGGVALEPAPGGSKPAQEQLVEEDITGDGDVDLDSILSESAGSEESRPDGPRDVRGSRPVVPAEPLQRASAEVAARGAHEFSLGETLRRLQRLAPTDPQQTLEELQELIAAQGPHPLVLARIAALQKELDPSEAMDTARRAASLAVKVGNTGVLGELYETFRGRMDELEVPNEQWQNVAAGQQSLGKDALATELYARLLGRDPANLAAIKGLIQIADAHLKSETGAGQALAIYEGLEKLCPDHPFVEFVERGREAASRRLIRVR